MKHLIFGGILFAVGTLLAVPAFADVSGFASFANLNASRAAPEAGFAPDRTTLTLTDGSPTIAASAFDPEAQRITSWRAQFTYRASDFGGIDETGADGAAFILQNDPRGVRALGEDGNSLGYAGGGAITRSAVFRLVLYPGSGQGAGVNGAAQLDTDTGAVDLRSQHPIQVTLQYDGAVLAADLKDLSTGDVNEDEMALDIPAAVGGDTALVGFSGGSGAASARQTISSFTFTVLPEVPPARRKRLQPIVHTYHSRSDYVDPFIGTDGGGNTYPGAVAPFGMVQFSPDTSSAGIGYTYHDRQIQGFSLTHMSGVGCSDYGDVFLTAITGPIQTATALYQSPYTHRLETAQPGYYQVKLLKPGVNVELSATEHAGVARFTFPAGKAGSILLPISHTLTHTYGASINVIGDDEVDGQVTSQSFCGAGQRYTVYFAMMLDRPFTSFGTWSGSAVSGGNRAAVQADENAPQVGGFVTFPEGVSPVTARIGISFVDAAGARANLQAELAGKSFDQVRKQAAAAWEKELGLVDVKGGATDQRINFYTSLYHCLLMPNLFSDVDGRYRGFDDQIHHAPAGHPIYANYSGWDIYRTEAPLLSLIEPRRMADMCQSIVEMYRQGGWIDRWPQANTYTEVMCGSPLTTVMATAWDYGIRGFDIADGYQGMMKDAMTAPPPGKPYYGEAGIEWMNRVGYIPDDKVGYGATSQTEEDCIAYASLAFLAQSLGKTQDAAMLKERALNWRNLFNPSNKFMSPRDANGDWVSFDPTKDAHFVEGSGWHYRWLVPEDAAGLIQRMGGDAEFNSQLDQFFSYPHLEWDGPYYNPYNEPDLQAPFLYDYSGAPWETQSRVRELETDAYKTTPEGVPGNDDCGTMSAWYVLSALGLYAVDPADGTFELTSPLFPEATIHLEAPYPGRTFTIRADSPSDAYVESCRLDGRTWEKPWIPQSAIARGGSLAFNLGPQPNKSWGAAATLRPPSLE